MKKFILIVIVFIYSSFLVAGYWKENMIPVFNPGEAYYQRVLYDANSFSGHGESYKYKMWYAGTNGATSSKLHLAGSDDGTNWTIITTMMTNLLDGAYHSYIIYDQSGFGGTTNFYKIWYWDYTVADIYRVEAIRTANSPDGKKWNNDQALTQNPANPIITGNAGDWNRGTYAFPFVIYNSNAINTGTNPFDYSYVMYYDGTTGGEEEIGIGYSINGIYWEYKQKGLSNNSTDSSAWDYHFATYPNVIKLSDNRWKMWFCGGQGNLYYGIGYAESTNGLDWTKLEDIPYIGSNASPAGFLGNPIVSKHDSNAIPADRTNRTYSPSILYDANRFGEGSTGPKYKMWFVGVNSADERSIRYASYIPELPTTPTNLQAVATIDYKKILISWHDASTNENQYYIDKKELGQTNFSTLAILVYNSSNYADSSVVLGKTYIYRISAVNFDGTNYALITNQFAVANPVIKISASDLSNDQGYGIVVNWSIPNNTFYSISNITSYILYRGSTTNSATNQISLLTNKTSFTDLSVIKNNSYVYKIYALKSNNFVDGNYSEPVKPIDNIAPQIPLSINANYSSGSVIVEWSRSPDDGAGANDVIAYRISRKLSTFDTFSNIVIVSNTIFNDLTAMDGKEYKYAVSAYDGQNFSEVLISTNIQVYSSNTDIKLYNNFINITDNEKVALFIPTNLTLSINIYSINGSLIKEIKETEYQANSIVYWDGTYKNTDSKVGAGIYFITVLGDNIKLKFKVLVIK